MATSAKGRNGVLPVPAGVTKKSTISQGPSKPQTKTGAPRLRLIVRRLPPGLTESEFWEALGEEWRTGAGKVEWSAYKDGKISKDSSKPSRPSRAYLKVKEAGLLDEISMKLRQTQFNDARNTARDACLLGPPSLEFAPYTRIPGSRVRHDGRQGTIDQDQEFIDFLQSLTEPVARSTNNVDGGDGKQSKITTTPLVQYLKEKKASKAKDAAAAKAKVKQEAKESKNEKGPSKTTVVLKNSPSASEKARMAKATQDAVKAINKSVASMQGKGSAHKSDTKAVIGSKDPQPPQQKPPRERGSATVANKILQRDLGLAPKETRTSRILKTTGLSTDSDGLPKVSISPAASENIKIAKPVAMSSTKPMAAPTGPRSTVTSSSASTKPVVAQAPRPVKPPPQPSPGAKSAFLKHANASQGVTEDLLRAAFEHFGELAKCEIDKKKGFGYVDFIDAEGLKKAMHASPVKVGNGQVVVLENKTRRPITTVISQTPGPSTPSAPTADQKSSEGRVSTIEQKADGSTEAAHATGVAPGPSAHQVMPPRAPRGRGTPIINRGGRGAPFGRGGFPRGNFRGRTGNRGGAAASTASPTGQPPVGSTVEALVTAPSGADSK